MSKRPSSKAVKRRKRRASMPPVQRAGAGEGDPSWLAGAGGENGATQKLSWPRPLAPVGNGHTNGHAPSKSAERRALPSVEAVLQALGPVGLPRATTVAVVRKEIAALRQGRRVPEFGDLLLGVRSTCEALRRSRLQPVINGSGVLLHTNLGRAPLGSQVVARLSGIAANYNNLEYDLDAGVRGSRAGYLESNLALLCGAEAATVVNNCAAALVLVLRHFTARKPEVLISRGELIQIGGGFRIPEILEASGATLREVGTTNKTALADYARAIGPKTALLLKVHRSNFVMEGFVESAPTPGLAALAHARRVPLVEDLGSGAILRTETIPGLAHEPTPGELLKQGVDLVTFSGDKLFAGPQAGIIAGKGKLVAALKREPFFRALRCDKLVMAALEATVDSYLEGNAEHLLPLLAMLHASVNDLRQRAERLVAEMSDLPLEIRVGQGKATVGGGSLPRSFIPSVTLDIAPRHGSPAEFASRMRRGSPPVIGCVAGERFRIDLRTVFPTQDEALLRALRGAAA